MMMLAPNDFAPVLQYGCVSQRYIQRSFSMWLYVLINVSTHVNAKSFKQIQIECNFEKK